MQAVEALARAHDALAGLSAPVCLRGDTAPQEGPFALLDLITTTPYGYGQDAQHLLQVSVYAERQTDAHELNEEAATLLEAAGYRRGQTRTAPDEEMQGLTTDWRL